MEASTGHVSRAWSHSTQASPRGASPEKGGSPGHGRDNEPVCFLDERKQCNNSQDGRLK